MTLDERAEHGFTTDQDADADSTRDSRKRHGRTDA